MNPGKCRQQEHFMRLYDMVKLRIIAVIQNRQLDLVG